MIDLFKNGAIWLRADFHLHTNTDNEFKYTDDKDYYNSNYVEALKNTGIAVGVIANHDQFDFGEFKELRKTAKKQGIFLLPGVELSVNDGANGIHMIIVFSDEWLKDDKDRISTFLASYGSDKNILETVNKLNKNKPDYFLIFAHVEDKKGLWRELGGGRLKDWREQQYQAVRERTLGFQQVRTRDEREKVKQWLGNWYPAEVEGSDPKSIEQIGRKESCYIKIGAFTFDAVKYALMAYYERLRLGSPPRYAHSHIKRICFEGGTLKDHTISFSPELNTLIGIRGSGKSSVLEALRYALGIKIEENESDYNYKRDLIGCTLGSGGKVILDAVDHHGQPYQIQRIFKENANVFIDGKLQPGVSIRETILNRPLFFGQKELAAANKGSEKDLVEKLLGTKCDEIRHQIAEQKNKVVDAIERLSKISDIDELIEEQTKAKQDAEYRLNFYKKHKLEEKLQKRLTFEKDIRKAEEGIARISEFYADISGLLANHEDDLRNFPGYLSTENAEFFKDFDITFSQSIRSVDTIKAELVKTQTVLAALKGKYDKLIVMKNGLADEFAKVERMLAEELKTSEGPNINMEGFLAAKNKLAAADAALTAYTKNGNQKNTLQMEMYTELQTLGELYLSEYRTIKAELDKVSDKSTALKLNVGFKEDKGAFLEFFLDIFRGSGLRKTTFEDIVKRYQDFAGLYLDFENAKQIFGKNSETFAKMFEQNMKNLLTFQTPNKYTITYHGMNLAHHSLGQRASALILFVLEQRENDVIIIDQPEDDLDNQTIYEDVIKLIRRLKPSVQFIFATHNPNIPVLGDAEQIHACTFTDGKINIQSGSLDEPVQQEKIVDIMEGGKEAFNRRREIYKIWK